MKFTLMEIVQFIPPKNLSLCSVDKEILRSLKANVCAVSETSSKVNPNYIYLLCTDETLVGFQWLV